MRGAFLYAFSEQALLQHFLVSKEGNALLREPVERFPGQGEGFFKHIQYQILRVVGRDAVYIYEPALRAAVREHHVAQLLASVFVGALMLERYAYGLHAAEAPAGAVAGSRVDMPAPEAVVAVIAVPGAHRPAGPGLQAAVAALEYRLGYVIHARIVP